MLMGTAVETASNSLWMSFAIGLIGALVGALASFLLERVRQRESRSRRWDDEILNASLTLLHLQRAVLDDLYEKPPTKQEMINWEPDLQKHIDEYYQHVNRLRLIASAEVSTAAMELMGAHLTIVSDLAMLQTDEPGEILQGKTEKFEEAVRLELQVEHRMSFQARRRLKHAEQKLADAHWRAMTDTSSDSQGPHPDQN